MTHMQPAKEPAIGCNEPARKLLPGRFTWFLSDRSLARDSARLAGCTPPTERWQDKRREVRPVGERKSALGGTRTPDPPFPKQQGKDRRRPPCTAQKRSPGKETGANAGNHCAVAPASRQV